MTWLTQAELRRDTPQARQLAGQLLRTARWDSGHGLVWNLFADTPDARRDFLYREADAGRFLIVSAREPQGEPAIWRVRSRPYAPALTAGRRYGFALRANPAVAVSRPGRGRSHRADVMMDATRRKGEPLTAEEREAAAMKGLYARAEPLGVSFDADRCATRRQHQMKLARPGGGKPAAVTMVDYEGVLTIVAPDRAAAALTAGVGHGKAFGLGLLLLRHLDA
jgi:CRISPR system Cascade subunit CasE